MKTRYFIRPYNKTFHDYIPTHAVVEIDPMGWVQVSYEITETEAQQHQQQNGDTDGKVKRNADGG
jgi:hypothetical protein